MSESVPLHPARNALVKLLALGFGLVGLMRLSEVLGGGLGFVGGLVTVVVGLSALALAVGLWRYQGWAYLATSLLLLVGWFVVFVRMIIGFDLGGFEAGRGSLIALVAVTVLIAIFSRWSMERPFRPGADAADGLDG